MARKKRRSPLLKLMRSDETYVYETTEEDVRYWFNILNREIFNHLLTPVDEVDIRWRRKQYAFYSATWDDKKTGERVISHTKLAMNKKYQSKQFFIEVLAHEMIHHWQILYKEPFGHGPSFLQWEDTFNRKGVSLHKVYRERNEKRVSL